MTRAGSRSPERITLVSGRMERTCRNLVLQFLDAGHDTVGTHVDVYHLAAAPMGMNVTFRAQIQSVNERRVNFKVEAFDEKEKVGDEKLL